MERVIRLSPRSQKMPLWFPKCPQEGKTFPLKILAVDKGSRNENWVQMWESGGLSGTCEAKEKGGDKNDSLVFGVWGLRDCGSFNTGRGTGLSGVFNCCHRTFHYLRIISKRHKVSFRLYSLILACSACCWNLKAPDSPVKALPVVPNDNHFQYHLEKQARLVLLSLFGRWGK